MEPLRLTELEDIRRRLSDLFEDEHHQIWAGDFNALTRTDYSDAQWQEVCDVRRRNRWEAPCVDVTARVKAPSQEAGEEDARQAGGLGMVDCWEEAGKSGELRTCRFDTRIDYVFASRSFLDAHKLVKCQHIVDSASDHNMILAEFEL